MHVRINIHKTYIFNALTSSEDSGIADLSEHIKDIHTYVLYYAHLHVYLSNTV